MPDKHQAVLGKQREKPGRCNFFGKTKMSSTGTITIQGLSCKYGQAVDAFIFCLTNKHFVVKNLNKIRSKNIMHSLDLLQTLTRSETA